MIVLNVRRELLIYAVDVIIATLAIRKFERIEKEIEIKMKSSYKMQKPTFLMYTKSDK